MPRTAATHMLRSASFASTSTSASSHTSTPSSPSTTSPATSPSSVWRPPRGGVVAESDDEGEDEEDDTRSVRSRLSRCAAGSDTTRGKRDLSNKENIAPLVRNISRQDQNSEQLTEQEEAVARRTRAGSARSLSLRQSKSNATVVPAPPSSEASSAGRRAILQRPRRSLARTQSSPVVTLPCSSASDITSTSSTTASTSTSSRKRVRPALQQARTDTRESRRRLDASPEKTTTSDAASSCCGFSSQTSTVSALSSLFDDQSAQFGGATASSVLSRATTPCDSQPPSSLPDHEVAKLAEGTCAQEKADWCDEMDVDPAADAMTTATDLDTCFEVVTAEANERIEPDIALNVYAHARSLLRYATSQELGTDSATWAPSGMKQQSSETVRASERAQVTAFLADRFPSLESDFPQGEAALAAASDDTTAAYKSNCLYICGTPGTGKTALLKDLLSTLKQKNPERVNVVYINCVAVSQPKTIFGKILKALGEDANEAADNETRLAEVLEGSETDCIIVLDEIDSLLEGTAHQSILYKLFMLSSSAASENSKTAIIGIANSLDLSDKFLPLLAAQNRTPCLINFQPFRAEEIIAIVKDRLAGLLPRYDLDHATLSRVIDAGQNGFQSDPSLSGHQDLARQPGSIESSVSPTSDEIPIFTVAALRLAAMKVAAVTGDIRRALDACRLAIEVLENEQRKKALDTVQSGTDNPPELTAQQLLGEWTPVSAPKVSPQHVLKALASVIGSPNLNKIRSLPLHAKLLLAAYFIARQRFDSGLSVLGTHEAGMPRTGSAHGVSLSDLEASYRKMLHADGSFSSLESSEILAVLESMETQGILDIGQPQASALGKSGQVSAAAKRSVKKQLLASERIITARIPLDEVAKGLTTVFSSTAAAPGEGQGSLASIEAVKRIIKGEETRIQRSRGWQQIARDQEQVRVEELGGGRGMIAKGL